MFTTTLLIRANIGNNPNGYINYGTLTLEYHLPIKNYTVDLYARMCKALLNTEGKINQVAENYVWYESTYVKPSISGFYLYIRMQEHKKCTREMHTNLLLVYSTEKNNRDFSIFPPNTTVLSEYFKRTYSCVTSCIILNGGRNVKRCTYGEKRECYFSNLSWKHLKESKQALPWEQAWPAQLLINNTSPNAHIRQGFLWARWIRTTRPLHNHIWTLPKSGTLSTPKIDQTSPGYILATMADCCFYTNWGFCFPPSIEVRFIKIPNDIISTSWQHSLQSKAPLPSSFPKNT